MKASFPNTTSEETCQRAIHIVRMQIQGHKPKRRVILYMLKNIKKYKSISLAVFSLLELLPYCVSFERKKQIYELLAEKISQCRKNNDNDIQLIEYLVCHSSDEVVSAMCHVIRFQWDFLSGDDIANLPQQVALLEEFNLKHYFSVKPKDLARLRKKVNR